MLDSFRRRDNQQTRSQSPYSQLQAALSPAGTDSAKPETSEMEAQRPAMQDNHEPSRTGEETVSKLIVGPDIKLKGAEITDCDTLVVEGRVEASMDSRVIQISEHGMFVGKAGIDVAEIRGRFEGELTARRQLVIRSTGCVSGKVRYGKIAIEEGGELSGDVAALAAAKGAGTVHVAADSDRKPSAVPAANVTAAQAGAGAPFTKPAGAPH